ncbi:hypothetical protein [Egicoccus halophilus]|uniref:Uncharacterized protein n=1 Tax=Egicoccus halophilus TaxID=1670830 RepID=A0A8J3AGW7_9ACTN|nr:hypothetical protein [Egicoccus halophilus]GGI09339.1 hypothetical protein GCM10011354_33580 [Egicoccus halophilus]
MPLFALLDNVRVETLRGGEPERPTDEEKLILSLLKQAPRDDLEFLPYSEPDIIAALPLVTVVRRFDAVTADRLDSDDGYWTAEIARWRREVG